MEKLLSVTVKGKEKTWAFNFMADPQYLDEWREDGLKIDEVVASYPVTKENMSVFLGLLTK